MGGATASHAEVIAAPVNLCVKLPGLRPQLNMKDKGIQRGKNLGIEELNSSGIQNL